MMAIVMPHKCRSCGGELFEQRTEETTGGTTTITVCTECGTPVDHEDLKPVSHPSPTDFRCPVCMDIVHEWHLYTVHDDVRVREGKQLLEVETKQGYARLYEKIRVSDYRPGTFKMRCEKCDVNITLEFPDKKVLE